MPIKKRLGFAFVLSGLLAVAGAAYAQPPEDYAHARRDEANDHIIHQNERVRENHQEREITARRAHESHMRHTEKRSMSAPDHWGDHQSDEFRR